MRRLYLAANLPEAHVVLDLLGLDGIEARVLNEHAHGGLGEIPFTHAYPEVWVVDERDLPRARRVVEEYERSSTDSGTSSCPACGELSPGNFEVCWHCGQVL